MKTIITLTDMPDGSVNIEYMTQRTFDEIEQNIDPEQARSYLTALMFSQVVEQAKAISHEMRMMHAEAIEKAEYGPCLH